MSLCEPYVFADAENGLSEGVRFAQPPRRERAAWRCSCIKILKTNRVDDIFEGNNEVILQVEK